MRTFARHITAGGARAYLYWFSHVPPHPQAARLGAYHASEIPSVFNNLQRADWTYTAIDRRIAETMSSYWVNFALTGAPNGSGLPKWTPYNLTEEPYMEFAATAASRNHFRKASLDFFDKALAGRGDRSQP